MDEATKHIVEGRKTFFIVPDASLLPETYLEDYMARGYETYIIGDDRYCPLETKIDVIIQTFTDSIIFFYIDTLVDGIDWHIYIRELQRRYGEKILIGVLNVLPQNKKSVWKGIICLTLAFSADVFRWNIKKQRILR